MAVITHASQPSSCSDDDYYRVLYEWPLPLGSPQWLVRFPLVLMEKPAAVDLAAQHDMVLARRIIVRRMLAEVHSKAAICVWDVTPSPCIAAYTRAWCDFTDIKESSLGPGLPVDLLALFPTGEKAHYLNSETRQRIAASLQRLNAVTEAFFTGRLQASAEFLCEFVSPVGRVRSAVVHCQMLRDPSGVPRQAINAYVDLAYLPNFDWTCDLSLPYAVNVDESRLSVAPLQPVPHPHFAIPPLHNISPRQVSAMHFHYSSITNSSSSSFTPSFLPVLESTTALTRTEIPHRKWSLVSDGSERRISVQKKKPLDPNFKCDWCGTMETPEARAGPRGKKTLCNRCGIRWYSQRERNRERSSSPDEVPDVAKERAQKNV